MWPGGHQTGQEWRSQARNLTRSLWGMDVTLSTCFIAVDDHEKALEFYRDALGLEVRNDVKFEGMRWLTVGSPQQPGVSIVLEPPAADPNASPADRQVLAELMAKGLLRVACCSPPAIATRSSSEFAPLVRKSSRSRWTSRTACVTVPFATPPATCCGSSRPKAAAGRPGSIDQVPWVHHVRAAWPRLKEFVPECLRSMGSTTVSIWTTSTSPPTMRSIRS